MNGIEWFGTICMGIGMVVVAAFLQTFPIMWLWNWLMPLIFGLPRITAWQALGLSVLSSFLVSRGSVINKEKK